MAYPGGFSEYIRLKQDKLSLQYGQETNSNIFKNKRFYFNGDTGQETMLDLKKIVTSHGATVDHYATAKTTHIIASQMTLSKLQSLKQPIVKPDWIYDSINQMKCLDISSYLLRKSNIPSFMSKTEPEQEETLNLSISCTAPGFIQKYFESSRLHHISSWKQELAALVASKMSKKTHKKKDNSIILHIDLDCFFASAVLRDKEDLKDKPVAIAHGDRPNSTSEIACVNYPARKFGIKNGDFVGGAKEKCPDLIVLSFDFPLYDSCSKQFYSIILKHCDYVQAVSCDEVYADVTVQFEKSGLESRKNWSLNFAHDIRKKIKEKTQIDASIGIGSNMLQARIATKLAKPNNAFYLAQDQVDEIFSDLSVRELIGVGWKLENKLLEYGWKTCGELKSISQQTLQNIFGSKTGLKLYEQVRGIDDRNLENKARISLGAEINWGIRFQNQDQVVKFFKELSNHVYNKMKNLEFHGQQITVKAKKKNYDGEAEKFLGCGKCIDFSKSLKTSNITEASLFKDAWNLFQSFDIAATEIRGIGIHLKTCEEVDAGQPSVSFPTTPKKQKTTTSPLKRPNIDFFSPKKSKFEQEFGVKLEDVDLSMIDYLPKDIQQEFWKYTNRKFYQDPSLSQIDPQVFNDLPSYVQKEVKESILQHKKQKPSDDVIEIIPKSQPRPNMLGETDFLTIKCWILEWLSPDNMKALPLENDVELVKNYLVSLVEHSLEQCHDILRWIKLAIQNKKGKINQDWAIAFQQLQESVGEQVKKKYGGNLCL